MKGYAAAIASSIFLAVTAPVFGAGTGGDIFEEHCAACHGTDGRGRTPAGRKLGAKDLTGTKLSAEQISRRILEGAKDAKGKARMPAFSDKVSPTELPAVVAYVQSLRK